MTERQQRIDEARQRQPIAELRRKASKAAGRTSRAMYIAEDLDLAVAEARQLVAGLRLE